HGTPQRVAILGRDFHSHEAAEAMSDNEGALAQLRSGHHGANFFGAKLRSVVRSPTTIAHTGQINCRDAKVAGEVRRNIAPPVAMRAAAMNEEKAALARPRRLARPNQVMDLAATATVANCDWHRREMAHRNQSGAGARIVRRLAGTASLLKEAARTLLH